MSPRVVFAAVAVLLVNSLLPPQPILAGQETTSTKEEANLLFQQGKLEEAVAAYTKVIRDNPRDVESLTRRADLYQSLGLPELANEDYDRAIRVAPGSVDLLCARSHQLSLENRDKESIRDLDAAIRINSTYVQAYRWRAQTYAILGQWAQAVSDYSRAIKLYQDNPGDASNPLDPDKTLDKNEHVGDFVNRASAQFYLGNYPEALVDYERAERGGVPYQAEHADCLIKLRRWKEAQELFDRILQSGPGNPNIPDGVAWMSIPVNARKASANDLSDDPDAAKYHALCQRAVTRAHLKEFDGAEADLAAAIALKPNIADAYGTAAWMRLLSGKLGTARDAALHGLLLDRTQTWIRNNLACVYLCEGHFDWAQSIFLQDKDKVMEGTKTRAEIVLEDFAQFRAEGVELPGMERMAELLRESPVHARRIRQSTRPLPGHSAGNRSP